MSQRKYSVSILATIAAAAMIVPVNAVAGPTDPATVTAVHAQAAETPPLGALRAAGGVNDAGSVAAVEPHPSASGDPRDGSFDWGEATIGAAGLLALLAVGGGVLFLSRRANRQPAGAG